MSQPREVSGEAVAPLLEGRVVESVEITDNGLVVRFTDGSRLVAGTSADWLDVALVEPT